MELPLGKGMSFYQVDARGTAPPGPLESSVASFLVRVPAAAVALA